MSAGQNFNTVDSKFKFRQEEFFFGIKAIAVCTVYIFDAGWEINYSDVQSRQINDCHMPHVQFSLLKWSAVFTDKDDTFLML